MCLQSSGSGNASLRCSMSSSADFSDDDDYSLKSGSVSPAPGDTLPWNLPRHERSKRKIQGGSILDPAERAVLRIAGKKDFFSLLRNLTYCQNTGVKLCLLCVADTKGMTFCSDIWMNCMNCMLTPSISIVDQPASHPCSGAMPPVVLICFEFHYQMRRFGRHLVRMPILKWVYIQCVVLWALLWSGMFKH